MSSYASRTIGRIAIVPRRVLMLGVLAVLAVVVVVSSGPVPRVQAADFDFALAIETKLTASDAAVDDEFGFSVSVSGDTAVVGARFDDDAGSGSGSAYVFVRNKGGADDWGEVQKLTASDAAAGDQFGNSVSVSGDTAVVGASFDDDAGSFSGSAYVFEAPPTEHALIRQGIDAIEAKLDASLDATVSSRASQTSVDALEAKLDAGLNATSTGATQASVDAIDSAIQALEAKLDASLNATSSGATQASVDAIDAKLDLRLDDTVSSRASSTDLGQHDSDLNGRADTIDSAIQALEAKLDASLNATSTGATQASVDAIEAKLDLRLDDTLSSRASQASLDERATDIDDALAALEGKLDAQGDAIEVLEAKMDAQAGAIAELKALQEGLVANLPQLNSNAGGKNK